MLASQVLKAGLRVRHSLEEVVGTGIGSEPCRNTCKLPTGRENSVPPSVSTPPGMRGCCGRCTTACVRPWPRLSLERAAEIEFRCVKALAWLELAGIAFDAQGWLARTLEDEAQLEALSYQLDRLRPGYRHVHQLGVIAASQGPVPDPRYRAVQRPLCHAQENRSPHCRASGQP